MKFIPVSDMDFAMIDDADFEAVNRYRWRLNPKGYPYTVITLHEYVMGKKPGLLIDHIDQDKLNAQKSNLRHVTASINTLNRPQNKGSSKYRGVSWSKKSGKWMVKVRRENKRFNIGLFEDELQAAMAYDIAAYDIWGEYAQLNFPDAIHGPNKKAQSEIGLKAILESGLPTTSQGLGQETPDTSTTWPTVDGRPAEWRHVAYLNQGGTPTPLTVAEGFGLEPPTPTSRNTIPPEGSGKQTSSPQTGFLKEKHVSVSPQRNVLQPGETVRFHGYRTPLEISKLPSLSDISAPDELESPDTDTPPDSRQDAASG